MKKIAVTGGKGGTGKSTIATALAVLLGKTYRVLLVDADVDCPNDHLILGIKRKKLSTVFQRVPEWDFEKCIKCGACGKVCKPHAIVSLKEKKPIFLPQQCNGCGACEEICPEKAIGWNKKKIGTVFKGSGHGIDFLAGELTPGEPVSEFVVESLNKAVEGIAKKYDFVVVDTAAGTHCDVISALKETEIALAVTEPTALGARDLELIIKLLKKLGTGFEIILNRFEGKKSEIENVCRRNGKQILAKIPYKKSIMVDYCNGRPVRDKAIEAIARAVEK